MDGLDTLQGLGFSLPTPAYLFGMLLFSVLGYAAWRHGKRMERPLTQWLGMALMLYTYLTGETWQLYLVGALLCGAVWWAERGDGF